MELLTSVPLLIIDDLGIRKLDSTAGDLPEIVMRRYERASTLLTSNRPVEDWGKLLGDRCVAPHARPDPASRTCAEIRPAKLTTLSPPAEASMFSCKSAEDPGFMVTLEGSRCELQLVQ